MSIQSKGGAKASFLDRLATSLSYSTVKVVSIKSWRLGILHLVFQIIILAYIIGFGLIYKKQYQGHSEVISATVSKVQGTAYTDKPGEGIRVYDSQDLIQPAHMHDEVFIVTNMWLTPGQARGVCEEFTTPNTCSKDKPCQKYLTTQHGVQNGECSNSSHSGEATHHVHNGTGGTCLVEAWCPVEREKKGVDFGLQGVANFSVFVRVNSRFVRYGISRDNTYGKPKPIEHLNSWQLWEILELAGTTFEEVKLLGAEIAFSVDWKCNFDHDPRKCDPTIDFYRLDDPVRHINGFNFRVTERFENGKRNLAKLLGVSISFLISGEGSKFDLVELLTAIGAGIGLLSVATVVVDFIALKLLGDHSKFYTQHKIKEIEDDTFDMKRGRSDAVTAGGRSMHGEDRSPLLDEMYKPLSSPSRF